jgi:hypothetical protein
MAGCTAMSYALAFADEFFVPDDFHAVQPSERPTSVWQAILSLHQTTRRSIAQDVFGVSADRLAPEAILAEILSTNTCSNLDEPIEVWIDPKGEHSIFVFSQV